jgi:hypothetical protein
VTDSRTVRLVVALLGGVSLGSLLIIGLLALADRDPGVALVTLLGSTGTTALGALASVLVSTKGEVIAPAAAPVEPLTEPSL